LWENYKPTRKESIRFKRMWVHKHLFQRKIVLDISEKKKEDLEEEAKIVLTDQKIDRMKGIG
jgi:hypothetical protein